MNQDLKKTNTNTNNLDPKLKFFAIFKLIMSIIYFVPSFFMIGLGLAINAFILIIGSGSSKYSDLLGFLKAMIYTSFYSILPTILSLILFIITIIFTIKIFKNKYNKTMDLVTSILFILINLFLIFSFKSSISSFDILLLIFSIIFILNIFFTIKNSNN